MEDLFQRRSTGYRKEYIQQFKFFDDICTVKHIAN